MSLAENLNSHSAPMSDRLAGLDLLLARAVADWRQAQEASGRPLGMGARARLLRSVLASEPRLPASFAATLLAGLAASLEAPRSVFLAGSGDSLAHAVAVPSFFGPEARVLKLGSLAAVFDRVRTEPGAAGVLPAPASGEERWWPRLMGRQPGGPLVTARLPVWAAAPTGYVVEAAESEPTGNDLTLLALEIDTGSAARSGERALKALGLKAALIDRLAEGRAVLELVEVAGHLGPQSALLGALAAPVLRVHVVGAYPAPIGA